MSELFKSSSNPYIRDDNSTTKIMLDVIIALIPASAFGIWHFGFRALLLMAATIASCVLTEFLYQKIRKTQTAVRDLSAVVTGLLLALNLPSRLPIWMGVLGGVFAILVLKQLFGGIGKNILNPAMGAKALLLIAFTSPMTSYTLGGSIEKTPLAILKAGGNVNLLDMFLGNTAGTIGETSVAALLIGAVYLLVKKVIDIKIPLMYLLTVAVTVTIYSFVAKGGFDFSFLLAHLLGGGLILAAFFIVTDYTTSPITPGGRILFGIIAGLLTGLFRLFTGLPENMCYGILLANLLSPFLERWTVPKSFGKGAEELHQIKNCQEENL